MYKTLQIFSRLSKNKGINSFFPQKVQMRTFLSQAYYCQEVWEGRLNNGILKKVNLDELFFDLDQRFQKTRQMSAVDVDIFANAINNDSHIEELLDLVHKLRLTADTCNSLNSMSHAVIRALSQHGNKEDLLNVLDDRINYGVFLDYYTANILFDIFWKQKDFTSGARVAGNLMLQEEFSHPISYNFSLLHCYNYLLKPEGWPEYLPPEEPEEEIKIRVKYLRNPYDDDHFDLKDPKKIVGKTLAMLTKGNRDSLNKSFNILGWALYDKQDKIKEILKETHGNIKLYQEVINLIPDDNDLKQDILALDSESVDIQNILQKNVEKAVQNTAEQDRTEQCKAFSEWEKERIAALDEQKRRLLVAKRLSHVEDLKKSLREKETKLWFFDNEEQIELEIEAKETKLPEKVFDKKTQKEIDENYIPPEVKVKQSN